MGRPITFHPDLTVLWDLAFLGFSDRHLALVLGCHQSLINYRVDLVRIIKDAREERAAAIVAVWKTSSQGQLRSADRADRLAELVAAAEQRKIRRCRP
jgi:hypothetical protein